MLGNERGTIRYWRRLRKDLIIRERHAKIVLGELYELTESSNAPDRWKRYEQSAEHFYKEVRYCEKGIAGCTAEISWLLDCVSKVDS